MGRRLLKVLIDTNLPITYITGRETAPDKDAVGKIVKLCADGKIEGFLALHSVSNMWFVMTRLKNRNTGEFVFSKQETRENIKDFCSIMEVVGADTNAVIAALDNESFSDFEDCLQEKCAITANADYIITSNIRDYQRSAVPAITPKDFLETLAKEEEED